MKGITEYVEKSKWKKVWNFRIRVDRSTGETLKPFTKVWKGQYVNYAGALFGAPPAIIDCWVADKQFTIDVLTGEIPS